MLDCIDARRGPCDGEVLERYSLSGSGMTFPRCDTHWDDYVAHTQPILDDIARRYPTQRPDDSDESYAGERWDEED